MSSKSRHEAIMAYQSKMITDLKKNLDELKEQNKRMSEDIQKMSSERQNYSAKIATMRRILTNRIGSERVRIIEDEIEFMEKYKNSIRETNRVREEMKKMHDMYFSTDFYKIPNGEHIVSVLKSINSVSQMESFHLLMAQEDMNNDDSYFQTNEEKYNNTPDTSDSSDIPETSSAIKRLEVDGISLYY